MKKGFFGSAIILTVVLLFCLSCEQNKQANQKVVPSSDDDKVLYTMGMMFGGKLSGLKLNKDELAYLLQGMKDMALGNKPAVEMKDYQHKVRDLFTKRMKSSAEDNKKAGDVYVQEFVAKEGGKKTKSGLAYKVLRPGKGKTPKDADVVEVHYKGQLIDGSVFDSSYERKDKVTFPLNRVIKGWTEGLKLISEGGKIKLAIPSVLGYGDHGAPPKIPGGSTLVFEVELFKVKDGDKKDNKKVMKKKTSVRKNKERK